MWHTSNWIFNICVGPPSPPVKRCPESNDELRCGTKMIPIKDKIVLNLSIPNEKNDVIIVDASLPSPPNEYWYTKGTDGTVIVTSNSSDIPLFLPSQSDSPSQILSRNLRGIDYGQISPKDQFSRFMRYLMS